MINSAFNKWAAAFVFALLGHAAIAFAWSGPIKPQLEKSSGAPVTIVGSLASFTESQEIEEITEITEAVEETFETEVEPLTTEITPIEEPVEELKQALLLAKTTIIREKPKTIKPEPAKKLKKKTPRKPKKANKRPPQKKSKASRKKAALKVGGGAKGEKRHRAGAATRANYRGRVQAHLARFKRKPRGNNKGRARVRFYLNKSGRLSSLQLSRSSGNTAVDRAVLSMVRRATPFPPYPPGLTGRQIINISILFN